MQKHNPAGPPVGPRPQRPAGPPPVASPLIPTPHHQDPPLSFWHHRFAQEILPFLASFALHLGLILAGLLTLHAINVVVIAPATQPYPLELDLDRWSVHPPDNQKPRERYGTIDGDPLSILRPQQNRTPDHHNGYAQEWGDDESALPRAAGGGTDRRLKVPGTVIAAGLNGAGSGRYFGPGDGSSPTGGRGGRLIAPFGPEVILAGTGRPDGGTTFEPTVARSVVFVCDASGSMVSSFDGLRLELQKAVNKLRPVQTFNVILFQDKGFMAIDRGLLMPATPENRRKAGEFLASATARGQTDPIPALELALRQKPELIHLLTDGDFADNDAVLAFVRQQAKGCRINTIAFINRGEQYERVLQAIAKETGGSFKYVSEESLSGR